MARTRKRSLWVAPEVTYATDPDADGSDYLWLPTKSIGDIVDGKQLLATTWQTGRNFPTASEVGADGWSFDFEVALYGLPYAVAPGDGVAPPADDCLDVVFSSIFGSQTSVSGEGVGVGSTASSLVLDTDVYGTQQIVPVYESTLPAAAPRTQWVELLADAANGTYGTVEPVFATAPTTTGVAFGTKTYQFDDDGGASLAFVYQEDELEYTLLGGRITDVSISAEVGAMVMMKCSVTGDRKSVTTKSASSLPTPSPGPVMTPIKSLLSPVWFAGTQYETKKIEISFGLQTSTIEATAAVNGRAGIDMTFCEPMITIEPLRTNAILDLKRNRTLGRLLVQLGAGVLSGNYLNTIAVAAEQASAEVVSISDDSGRLRQSVQFKISDARNFATGPTVLSRFFQLVRA